MKARSIAELFSDTIKKPKNEFIKVECLLSLKSGHEQVLAQREPVHVMRMR